MLLLLLFGMALAWFLQKKLYQKNWQKNLKIQVSFQDSAIYEGEESTTNCCRFRHSSLAFR